MLVSQLHLLLFLRHWLKRSISRISLMPFQKWRILCKLENKHVSRTHQLFKTHPCKYSYWNFSFSFLSSTASCIQFSCFAILQFCCISSLGIISNIFIAYSLLSFSRGVLEWKILLVNRTSIIKILFVQDWKIPVYSLLKNELIFFICMSLRIVTWFG